MKFVATLLLVVEVGFVHAADSAAGNLVPKTGRGVAPRNARGSGPWATRVMLATSSNGLDFTRVHFVVSDQAGVPNAIVDADRRARIYYVDFGNGNLLACAVQQRANSVTNWAYRRVHITGLPGTQAAAPADPCVVRTDDGRYRLYFMQAAPLASFYSAISSNGFDFAKEDGVRFTAAPRPCFDPTVLKAGNQWLLWGGPNGGIFAHSTDGLKFARSEDFRVKGVPFMPWSAVALPGNNGCRLFGNFIGPGEWSGGVSSLFSRDGKTWIRDPGIRLSLDGSRYRMESQISPDNGCALLPNGTWLMAYVATIPESRRR